MNTFLSAIVDIRFIYVALLFVCWDIVTGIISALVTHTFKSSIMREGGVHKLGIILTIAFVISLDIAQTWVNIGLSIPLTSMACTFITAMELGSSWENLKKIWPDLGRMKAINDSISQATDIEGLEKENKEEKGD